MELFTVTLTNVWLLLEGCLATVLIYKIIQKKSTGSSKAVSIERTITVNYPDCKLDAYWFKIIEHHCRTADRPKLLAFHKLVEQIQVVFKSIGFSIKEIAEIGLSRNWDGYIFITFNNVVAKNLAENLLLMSGFIVEIKIDHENRFWIKLEEEANGNL